jgi:hypothetical protein
LFAAEGKDHSKQPDRADPHAHHRHISIASLCPGSRAKVRRNDLVQAARRHCSATEPRDSVRPGLMFHIWQKEIETVCCTVSLKNDIAIPD